MACITFKNCNKCYWCRHICKYYVGSYCTCRLFPDKRFKHPKLNGWFCKHFCRFKEGERHETR